MKYSGYIAQYCLYPGVMYPSYTMYLTSWFDTRCVGMSAVSDISYWAVLCPYRQQCQFPVPLGSNLHLASTSPSHYLCWCWPWRMTRLYDNCSGASIWIRCISSCSRDLSGSDLAFHIRCNQTKLFDGTPGRSAFFSSNSLKVLFTNSMSTGLSVIPFCPNNRIIWKSVLLLR